MKSLLVPALLAFVITGCGQKQESPAPAKPAAAPASSGNPLTAPTDYLGAVAKAKKLSEGTIETASVGNAIQLFQAQEGRFPKDLNELVTQKYLAALPKPPYQMKFDYNAKTGEFKVVPQ